MEELILIDLFSLIDQVDLMGQVADLEYLEFLSSSAFQLQ